MTRKRRLSRPGVAATPRRLSKSRSGTPSKGDQLRPISTTWPNRSRRASIRSGSSRAIDAVWGHHAPSIPSPRQDAKVYRTGLLKRRPCRSSVIRCGREGNNQRNRLHCREIDVRIRVIHGRFLIFAAGPARKRLGRLIKSDRTKILSAVARTRITADYETVQLRPYTRKHARVSERYSLGRTTNVRTKSVLPQSKRVLVRCRDRVFADAYRRSFKNERS